MNIHLKGIAVGEWRELTEKELDSIFKLIENSSSTPNKRRNPNRKRKRW
jgi:23S rRNA pseudouridine2604 synthase